MNIRLKSYSLGKRHNLLMRPKSKRTHQYLLEQAKKLRFKVLTFSLIILGLLIFYLLFYSSLFKLDNILVTNDNNTSFNDAGNTVTTLLKSNYWLIFPQDNYFLSNKRYIKEKIGEIYPLAEISIDKSFPSTILINLKQKIGQSIWIVNEQSYLIDSQGKVIKQLPSNDFTSFKIPIIYDLSNTRVNLNELTLDSKVLDLILNIQQDFNSYNLPKIELDYFKVDSPKVNYVKLVTKQGFEIHFNTLLSLDKQIFKLQRSLGAGKIDLTNISYINLRIGNQVIYK